MPLNNAPFLLCSMLLTACNSTPPDNTCHLPLVGVEASDTLVRIHNAKLVSCEGQHPATTLTFTLENTAPQYIDWVGFFRLNPLQAKVSPCLDLSWAIDANSTSTPRRITWVEGETANGAYVDECGWIPADPTSAPFDPNAREAIAAIGGAFGDGTPWLSFISFVRLDND